MNWRIFIVILIIYLSLNILFFIFYTLRDRFMKKRKKSVEEAIANLNSSIKEIVQMVEEERKKIESS